MSWSHDYWPKDQHDYILGLLRRANHGTLPQWAMLADLVHLAERAHADGRDMLGRRMLEVRWGASERAVRNVLAEPTWQAAARDLGVAVEDRKTATRPLAAQAIGHVYFVSTDADGAPVKVGYTDGAIEHRLQSLQTGAPSRLVVIGCVPGARSLERTLHRELAAHRLHGEWFERGPALAVFERLHAQAVRP